MAFWVSRYPFVGKLWRELLKEFLDTYRPELHYMRGPGPRWREKHDAASPHSGGTQAGAQDVSKDFRIGAPGMSPLPGLVRTRPARPLGRPHFHSECR